MNENNLYEQDFEIVEREEDEEFGSISEKEILLAGKQILLGLAIIAILAMIGDMIKPSEGRPLLEICTTTLPPLATLIIAFYFKDNK